MSVKSFFILALVMTVLGLRTASGQTPYGSHQKSVLAGAKETPLASQTVQESPGLSDWITNRRSGCCQGPVGNDPPIHNELYLRIGPTFPVGGRMGDVLATGWAIQGGVRALFFNKPEDAAWIVDVGLSNHNNEEARQDVQFPITFAGGARQQVTVREFNRTFVNLGGGREWYWLSGTDQNSDWKWRVGVDGGGRYGSAKADFFEIRHRTDVIGGVYLGGYGDMECHLGGCLFHAGLRTEWAYTWSDILQQQSDVQEINVLFTVGVRY